LAHLGFLIGWSRPSLRFLSKAHPHLSTAPSGSLKLDRQLHSTLTVSLADKNLAGQQLRLLFPSRLPKEQQIQTERHAHRLGGLRLHRPVDRM
jgi:hypothetical protein